MRKIYSGKKLVIKIKEKLKKTLLNIILPFSLLIP